jgi:hypothetical protein
MLKVRTEKRQSKAIEMDWVHVEVTCRHGKSFVEASTETGVALYSDIGECSCEDLSCKGGCEGGVFLDDIGPDFDVAAEAIAHHKASVQCTCIAVVNV